jgi:VWFA-related protein
MPFSKRAPLRLALFIFVMLSVIASQTSSSQKESQNLYQSQTVLRANTRLVIVDVVASDAKGQPTRDLQRDDFTVLENGQPQKISNFTFHHPGGEPAVRPVRLAPNVVSNAPQFQAGSLNVILFDTVNGELSEHAYAKDQLLRFLSTAELKEPVAIFALETKLKLLHDFSTDAGALKASVQPYRPPAHIMAGESVESRASAFSNKGNFHTSERDIETTLNQLNVLAKMLKGYPGRKNLIWLSESFPLNLFPETGLRSSISGSDLRSAETSQGGRSLNIRKSPDQRPLQELC